MRGDNLREKLAHIAEHWSPKTVATVNDYDVRLAKVHGEFVRHPHPESATLAEPTNVDESDEFFLVIEGELTIRLDDGEVVLGPGEIYVVPRGTPHQPHATVETSIMLFEPREIVNTGDAGGPLTAVRDEI